MFKSKFVALNQTGTEPGYYNCSTKFKINLGIRRRVEAAAERKLLLHCQKRASVSD